MPPQTRNQARQLENDPEMPDRVDQYATLFPVFVTSPVPLEILDELIDEAREGLCALVDGGIPGCSLCILDIKDLGSIKHGSRKPMQPFESPFIGMTDDEIRSWMHENRHPNFAQSSFVVLDNATVNSRTCRIGNTYIDDEDGDKMLITDFYASMNIMVPLEMSTISWRSGYVGTGKVFNRKCIEEGQ